MRFEIAILAVFITLNSASARDTKGYAQSDPEMHRWFEQLRSGRGDACCALTDGNTLQDSDWRSLQGHFQVFLDDEWVDVPDAALVKGPNRYGRTVVWPYHEDGRPSVRCFLPGSMM